MESSDKGDPIARLEGLLAFNGNIDRLATYILSG